MPPVQPKPTTSDEKLDAILACLQRMDRRDMWRTRGALIRSLLGIIPLALFLASAWYVYSQGDQFFAMIAKQAATAAAEATKSSSQGFFEDIMKQYSVPKK